MTHSERVEQVARDVHETVCTALMFHALQRGFSHTDGTELCEEIARFILQREASLLKVAEAAHDMLRDYRSIGEQTQGYRTIEVFGRPLAKLQVALDAWQKGRTP